MDRNSILVTRSSMPTLDEYVDEIRPLWDSHWLTNAGLEHRKLESELQSYLNVPHASLFVNGHSALEGAIEAMDITGEAITTPFSFASTTHALVRRGVKPVFCDIRKDDYTIDVSKIEALITPRTTAIVPVHVYGNVCDVDAIQRIARKHGLKVIYDGAHSFGVKKNGQSTATFGDATMFSFHATKVFNTIEGGAVCYHDDFLTPELARVRNFGITGPETVLSVGGNAKMNEFCGSHGNLQSTPYRRRNSQAQAGCRPVSKEPFRNRRHRSDARTWNRLPTRCAIKLFVHARSLRRVQTERSNPRRYL